MTAAPLFDLVESLGARVVSGQLGRDEAVRRILAGRDLTEAGAGDLLDRWETARADYARARARIEGRNQRFRAGGVA